MVARYSSMIQHFPNSLSTTQNSSLHVQGKFSTCVFDLKYLRVHINYFQWFSECDSACFYRHDPRIFPLFNYVVWYRHEKPSFSGPTIQSKLILQPIHTHKYSTVCIQQLSPIEGYKHLVYMMEMWQIPTKPMCTNIKSTWEYIKNGTVIVGVRVLDGFLMSL